MEWSFDIEQIRDLEIPVSVGSSMVSILDVEGIGCSFPCLNRDYRQLESWVKSSGLIGTKVQ